MLGERVERVANGFLGVDDSSWKQLEMETLEKSQWN